MNKENPFIEYKFTGFKSFVKILFENGIKYDIILDTMIEDLFTTQSELINKNNDCISFGKAINENKNIYFLEVGILLKDDLRSYIAFLYDHYPALDELIKTVENIGPLIVENLNRVQEEEMAALKETNDKQIN
jgi:hypothetical protein